MLLKEGHKVEFISFVLNGQLEVYTEFEGNEFILDKLYSGSILNAKTFIIEDKMRVSVRSSSSTSSYVLKLGLKLLDDLMFSDENVKNSIKQFYNYILSKEKSYPLDYIAATPYSMLDHLYSPE